MAHIRIPHACTQNIRYSPSFLFLKDGKVIDEVIGKDAQRLEDHLWLHSDG
jgi:thioredoxin 1